MLELVRYQVLNLRRVRMNIDVLLLRNLHQQQSYTQILITRSKEIKSKFLSSFFTAIIKGPTGRSWQDIEDL
ncbi:unnamed protein product [Allacma fusca]|uniref:Uncharacterized protein n=1 Tax=Allacma fusca TaxID=39272 RepID=A0A8J2MA25_9HEXA|nr:unnamed protein product [Allacma fusca]